MAIVWSEGFEAHGNSTYIARKYAVATNAPGALSPGRLTGSYGALNGSILVTPSQGVENEVCIGIGVRASSVISPSPFSVRLFTGATEQLRLEMVSSGGGFAWALKRGATTLVTTGTVHAFNVWHYFELKATIRTGSNGSYEIRHNEITLTSSAGVNTANAGSDGADVLGYGYATSGVETHVDDLYWDHGAGADFKGDSYLKGVFPNADGDNLDWTPSTGMDHYVLVDDAATAPNDADYVSSAAPGDVDTYEYGDLSVNNDQVIAVLVWTAARMAAAGSRQIRAVYEEPGNTLFPGDTKTVASTSTAEFLQVFETNPDTGMPWEITEINDGRFGVESV